MKRALVILSLMLLLPLVSAEMFISHPQGIYNLADEFVFNVTIIPSLNMNDFFITKIICPDNEVEIYRTPLSLGGNEEKVIAISGRFDNFLAGNLRGTCYLSAIYGSQSAKTSDFEITENVYVNVGTDKVIMNPGERFNVTGRAIKSNGEPVNGFIEIEMAELGIKSFKTITNGEFNFLFSTPENARAGDYVVSTKVYEKDGNGDITNQGTGTTNIRINHIIMRAEIAINEQSVIPDDEFVYSVVLYDQADEEVVDNSKLTIYMPNGKIFSEELVESGSSDSMTIKSEHMPGMWKMKVEIGEIKGNRTFHIEELERADFNLVNGTLIVTNTGNVAYEKPIEVEIGGVTEVEEVYIPVGETKRFVLSAPDGEYSVSVGDGSSQQSLGTSFLTGGAIRVDSEGSAGFWRKSYLLIWIMLISIAALIAIQQYGRISNRTFTGKAPSGNVYAAPINVATAIGRDAITQGSREECSVISLRIKNSEEIDKMKGSAKDAIERALTRARDARAKIYTDKNYKTMIFAPSVTKQKENSVKAVAIAHEIEHILTEHNKRLADKVMFGIGVHNGEMIVQENKGQFRFNSIGNTLPYAKKIADTVSYGTGMSEHVHRRTAGKAKGERVDGTNYWRVRKVIDREIHSEFINKFVQKQKKEGTFKR